MRTATHTLIATCLLLTLAGTAMAQPAGGIEPTNEPNIVNPPPVVLPTTAPAEPRTPESPNLEPYSIDYTALLFVFMLATFIGLGVILRVSRLLHTPLMSLTNAISAIAVVGSIIVTGDPTHPWGVRMIGAIALFCSMTNIVSGFLITDRMLKMFKQPGQGGRS